MGLGVDATMSFPQSAKESVTDPLDSGLPAKVKGLPSSQPNFWDPTPGLKLSEAKGRSDDIM